MTIEVFVELASGFDTSRSSAGNDDALGGGQSFPEGSRRSDLDQAEERA